MHCSVYTCRCVLTGAARACCNAGAAACSCSRAVWVAVGGGQPVNATCAPGCVNLDFFSNLAGLPSSCVCISGTIAALQAGLDATRQVRQGRAALGWQCTQHGCAALKRCMDH